MEELEELLAVERIHTSYFTEWERKATDPLAKTVFRLAADKEANHVEWVKALIEIAKSKKNRDKLGVDRSDLEYWVKDEGGEGESYMKSARKAREPWVRAVLGQIGNDETTNAELLKTLLDETKKQ